MTQDNDTKPDMDAVWSICIGDVFIGPPVTEQMGIQAQGMFGTREEAEHYAVTWAEQNGAPRNVLRVIEYRQANVYEL